MEHVTKLRDSFALRRGLLRKLKDEREAHVDELLRITSRLEKSGWGVVEYEKERLSRRRPYERHEPTKKLRDTEHVKVVVASIIEQMLAMARVLGISKLSVNQAELHAHVLSVMRTYELWRTCKEDFIGPERDNVVMAFASVEDDAGNNVVGLGVLYNAVVYNGGLDHQMTAANDDGIQGVSIRRHTDLDAYARVSDMAREMDAIQQAVGLRMYILHMDSVMLHVWQTGGLILYINGQVLVGIPALGEPHPNDPIVLTGVDD